jgi:hypothetical protein
MRVYERMFVGTGRPRKPEERAAARELRREALSYKRIAAILRISASSALYWTRDIELTPEQVAANLGTGITAAEEVVSRRARAWSERSRNRRLAFQLEGRVRAREGDCLHNAGCMLYWAERTKSKNAVGFSNSDISMVAFFLRFLTTCFEVEMNRLTLALHVYLNNGLTIAEIEDHWLDALDLPRSCLRKHQINPLPSSSSGSKRNRLPYGVGSLKYTDTRTVQHIYGAIQEYAGVDNQAWLGVTN